jgi:hypothetical protein
MFCKCTLEIGSGVVGLDSFDDSEALSILPSLERSLLFLAALDFT